MSRLWSKSFILILVISLTAYLGHFMLLTSLSDFTLSIGGTAADAGLVSFAFTLAALLFRPIFGKLLDARGRRIVLIIGMLVISAAAILYPLLAIVPMLILIRFANGAGFSAFSTSSGTIIADIVPAGRLNAGIGYVGIAGTISTALGPMLGLYLAKQGFGQFFLAVAAISVAALLLALFVDYEKKARATAVPGRIRGKLFEKKALGCAITVLLMNLPLDAIMIFVASYGSTRKMSLIGLFFTVHAVAMFLAKLILGPVADRLGPNRIFLPSMALGVISMIMLAYAQTDIAMLIASFIFGIPMGIATTIINTVLIRTSPKQSIGAANATFMAFGDIGSGLGAVILGFVIQRFGFTVFFIIAGACFTLSVGAYMIMLWKKAHQLFVTQHSQ